MNSLGIEIFLSKVNVGNDISIRSTNYGDITYQGTVIEITDRAVWVQCTMLLDLFETLAIPALEEFKYEDIWWYDASRQVEVIEE